MAQLKNMKKKDKFYDIVNAIREEKADLPTTVRELPENISLDADGVIYLPEFNIDGWPTFNAELVRRYNAFPELEKELQSWKDENFENVGEANKTILELQNQKKVLLEALKELIEFAEIVERHTEHTCHSLAKAKEIINRINQ